MQIDIVRAEPLVAEAVVVAVLVIEITIQLLRVILIPLWWALVEPETVAALVHIL